jgi:hypothetical protein
MISVAIFVASPATRAQICRAVHSADWPRPAIGVSPDEGEQRQTAPGMGEPDG